MSTPEGNLKKLREKRDEIFARTTKEERVAQMEHFIKKMRDFGTEHFPNEHLRHEEEDYL